MPFRRSTIRWPSTTTEFAIVSNVAVTSWHILYLKIFDILETTEPGGGELQLTGISISCPDSNGPNGDGNCGERQ